MEDDPVLHRCPFRLFVAHSITFIMGPLMDTYG